MIDIAANYRMILQGIGAAAARSGREAGAVRMLAASKSQSMEKVQTAIAAGIRLFGENYVQEAAAKKAAAHAPVEWHMIGHLQRNKVKAALDLFDVIESLDNLGLAQALEKEAAARGRIVRALVEVNLAGEENKSGLPQEALAPLLEAIEALPHLRIEGLMAVPPLADDPEKARPYFRALAELREKFKSQKRSNIELKELSMGMSHDYRRGRDARAHRHGAVRPAGGLALMVLLSYVLEAVAGILGMLLQLYVFILIGRIIVSWVNADPYNPIVRFLYMATEPVLYRIRRLLPLYVGGFDFSAMVIVIVIYILQSVLVRYLYYLAETVRYSS
jgi:PLP dependent protein